MSYPTYEDVKATSNPIFKIIPQTWDHYMLKWVTPFIYGESLAATDREDGSTFVYGSNGPVGTHSRANTDSPCIIIGRKGSYGKVNYSEDAVFAIDTTFYTDVIHTKHHLRWLYYLLSAIELDTLSQDTGVPGLSREDALTKSVAVPPLAEQQRIAAFLDAKTAEIDELIALKEQQVALLQRKRVALISRAVTKGLDAAAPMRDSGVAWLGAVPVGWEVRRLKFTCMIDPSKSELATLPRDTLVSFVPMEKVGTEGELELDITRPLEEVLQGFTYFRDGDVIVAKITPCFENGKGAFCQGLAHGIGFGSTEFYVLRPHQGYMPEFIYYLTHSHFFRSVGTALMQGSAGQKRIQNEFVQNFAIGWPSVEEQHAIVAYLDRETAHIDELVATIEAQTEKLRVYRQALITAAVTGKIDVQTRGAAR